LAPRFGYICAAVTELSRKDLKRPDEFITLTHRAWAFLQDNARYAVLVGAGAGTILAVVAAWTYFSDKRAGGATAELGQILDRYARPIVVGPAPDGGTAEPEFRSLKERCDAVLSDLDKLTKDYAGSPVAGAGALLRASCLLDAGRDDDAIKAYRAYLGAADGSDPYRFLAHEGLGYAYEHQRKWKEATDEFRGMAPEGSSYRDRAMWHEARLLERQGRKDEARALYGQILEKFPSTRLRDEIATRLGALDTGK
jgi:tetratricopeptide (TPR) repeat protein